MPSKTTTDNMTKRGTVSNMFGIIVVFTEIYTWSVVCGADVSWTELPPLQNSLHFSDFPNRTTPSSISCIALGTSMQGCSHVTYVYSTSTCYFHSKLERRQSIKNSRVWSREHRCPTNFTHREQIGACIYVSSDTMTWAGALLDCHNREARLLVTTTTSKFKGVEDEITENGSFWVGGYVPGFGSSEWVTGESVEFADFNYIPDNDISGTDTCLLFMFKEQGGMVMTNQICGTSNRYICEII